MEHYDELIKLRKKNGIDVLGDINIDGLKFLPASLIGSLFNNDLQQKEKRFLQFENEILFCRGLVPVPFEHNLKNIVLVMEKNESVSRVVKELYLIETYNPYYSLIQPEKLSVNTGNAVKKAQTRLLKIKEAMEAFAVGQRNNKTFTMVIYNSIDKNSARVFIENNCSIVYAFYKNIITLYFDPMLFSEEDLEEISAQISVNFNIETKVNVDYDNYSIYFNSADITGVQIFNLINDNEKYHIAISENSIEDIEEPIEEVNNTKQVEVETQNIINSEVKEDIFKPTIKKNFNSQDNNDENLFETKKIKISHKIRKK